MLYMRDLILQPNIFIVLSKRISAPAVCKICTGGIFPVHLKF